MKRKWYPWESRFDYVMDKILVPLAIVFWLFVFCAAIWTGRL